MCFPKLLGTAGIFSLVQGISPHVHLFPSRVLSLWGTARRPSVPPPPPSPPAWPWQRGPVELLPPSPPSRCPLAGLSPFPLTPPHSPPALSPAPQLVSHSFHHPLCPSSTTRGGLKDKTGLDHLFPDPPRPPHSGPQDYSLVLADLCAPFDHLATLVLATSDTPTACTA